MKEEKRLKIGDIVIQVESVGVSLGWENDDVYRDFSCDSRPDIILRLHYGNIPDFSFKEKMFDTAGVWALYSFKNKYIIRIPSAHASVCKLAILESDFKLGDIYINSSIESFRGPLYPLDYPLGQLLMIMILSLREGMIAHACGVRDHNQGILFVGASGAGKSTIANLWKNKEDVHVLSDDRIIIRAHNGFFWMYGTPWYGEAGMFSPEKTLLEKIFFLNHAKENTLVRKEGIQAASTLLTRSFPPFWSLSGMESFLRNCHRLSREVPCYELGFVPDEDIIDFVKNRT